MKTGLNGFLEKAGGPALAVALHVVVVAVLLKVLVFRAPEEARTIDVQVVEEQVRRLDEVERKPEKAAEPASEALEADAALAETLKPDDLPRDALPGPALDLAGLDAVAEVQSPLSMKGLMAGRSAEGRQRLLREYGGRHGAQAEQAVLRGLDWLQSVQDKDGSWGVGSSKSMTAKQERARLTGLSLLCYLAHGETGQSEKYGETVQRAMQYLLGEQDARTGLFCPLSSTVGSHDDIGVYGHAIATYALAEAHALTRAPALKPPVERAVAVIVKGQQPGGGWDHRYQRAQWSDLSVAGWQIQALKAALSAGIAVEGSAGALERSVAFVQGMHAGGGKFYYRLGSKSPSADLDYMAGVAVLCLQLAGHGNAPEARAGLDYLRDVECSDWGEGWEKTARNKSFNIAYEWYYSTQAIFQRGGSKWTSWNNKFAPMLIGAQDASGAWKPPAEARAHLSKDILYTTGFCTLSLQVYYRILPSFQRVEAAEAPFVFENDVRIAVF